MHASPSRFHLMLPGRSQTSSSSVGGPVRNMSYVIARSQSDSSLRSEQAAQSYCSVTARRAGDLTVSITRCGASCPWQSTRLPGSARNTHPVRSPLQHRSHRSRPPNADRQARPHLSTPSLPYPERPRPRAALRTASAGQNQSSCRIQMDWAG
jgi:hypothetical protein